MQPDPPHGPIHCRPPGRFFCARKPETEQHMEDKMSAQASDIQAAGGGFVTTAELAQLRPFFKQQTWRKMRWDGAGPAFYKVGKVVLYSLADVDDWVQAHRREGGPR